MTHVDLSSSHGLIERGLGKSHAIWTIAMVGAVFALQSSVTALVLSPDALSFGSEATQVSQANAATTASNTKAQALKSAMFTPRTTAVFVQLKRLKGLTLD